MKKILYVLLLAAEAFVGTLLLMGLWNSTLYMPMALAIICVVGLLIFQLVRLFKATDPVAKRRIYRNIALIFLIPGAVFFITYVFVAVTFIIAFS